MLLLIDESSLDETRHLVRYVVGVGVMDPVDREKVRERMRQVTGNRSRPFHWAGEGPIVRRSMVDALVELSLEAVAASAWPVHQRRQEHARSECLMRIFGLLAERSVNELLIETREKAPGNVGQNRLDHGTIVDARHAGLLAPRVKYGWAGKDEPLLWTADAIAGIVGDAARGAPAALDDLVAGGVAVTVVRFRP